GFTPKVAEFVGKAVEGETFTIYYPNENIGSSKWSVQTQDGNDNIDHLKYEAALVDVNDYTSFVFSDAWAQEHEGTLSQTGVMKFEIAVPDTVTAVSSITLTAQDALFYEGNGDTKASKLSLNLSNVEPDANHIVKAWMTTSCNAAEIPAGTEMVLSVSLGSKNLEKDIVFSNAAVLMSGKVNTFKTDKTGWHEPSHYSAGKGTEESPWIIKTLSELLYMQSDLVAGETKYFKLAADIDMAGVTDWEPLNAASPYDKLISFDGDNHTIKNFTCGATTYPSFFGVLCGTCKNVTFTDAVINSGVKNCGILGGYGGVGTYHCTVENTKVQGTINHTSGNLAGGMFGTCNGAVIKKSSADVTIVSAGQMCGGLFGADKGDGVEVSDCWTSGSITSTSSICGGICGDLVGTGSSIKNSYSTMNVTTQYILGGIVGRAVAGSKSNANNCNNLTPGNVIENCIAWNGALVSNCTDSNEHYSSGAVVGGTAVKNTLKGCVRKPGMTFTDCPKNTELGTYGFFDQEDADATTPLVKGAGTYAFAYHGKVAADGKTLSQVAEALGWDNTIWDFTSDIPTHK
nr:hypothetical protein [Bacteroidales bacterium]